MMYELSMTYNDGTFKKEQATLPNIMRALSIYVEDNSWTYAQIENRQTGEIIAMWSNHPEYGITVVGC